MKLVEIAERIQKIRENNEGNEWFVSFTEHQDWIHIEFYVENHAITKEIFRYFQQPNKLKFKEEKCGMEAYTIIEYEFEK